jgi:hypothetical protein
MIRPSFGRYAPSLVVLFLATFALNAQTPSPMLPEPSAPPQTDEVAPAALIEPMSDAPPATAQPAAAPALPPIDSFGGGRGMGPGAGAATPRFSYRTTWLPEEPVAGQAAHLGYVEQDLSLSTPIWHEGGDVWSTSLNVRSELFQTNALLPTTGDRFPPELWDVRLGTAYQHLFDNGWVGGANLSVGSASDRPFAAFKDMTVGASGSLRVPQGERNAWIFSLNYSTNSQVLSNIPIPGVAYFYNPNEWFQATIGFPFANMTYRATDDLTLQFSYALLTNIHTKAIYRLGPMVRLYGGFDWNNEGYLRADRVNDQDRFQYNYKQVGGGVQVLLSRNADLDFSSGYDFDRFYYEGKGTSSEHNNRVDVGDGPYVGAKLSIRY